VIVIVIVIVMVIVMGIVMVIVMGIVIVIVIVIEFVIVIVITEFEIDCKIYSHSNKRNRISSRTRCLKDGAKKFCSNLELE
jgi:hypothetical protein